MFKTEKTMELTKTPKTIPEGKICDYIDGKFRSDTPEEYVRQTLEKRLVNEHKYLPSQISVEYPCKYFPTESGRISSF